MATFVGQLLYLFLPLLISAAVVGWLLRTKAFRAFPAPIDAGFSLGGRRLFGDHKTWGVALVTVVVSVATVAAQRAAHPYLGGIQLIDYDRVSPIAFGAALGGGAMLGELPNSFAKRRLGIPPGSAATGWAGLLFYVWDQIDLLFGVWPLVALLWIPPVSVVVGSFALALALHPVIAFVGYAIGARRTAR